MAFTEEQEAKLLQLLAAYENGKKVSDLPEVEGDGVSSGLMVEVIDHDGESRKFDLGNTLPRKKTLSISIPGHPSSEPNYPVMSGCQIVGDIDEKGYNQGDEISLLRIVEISGENPEVLNVEFSRDTILSSSLNSDGDGFIVAATRTGGIATYICNGKAVVRSTSCEPAFTIYSFESRTRIADAEGNFVKTGYIDPTGVPVLDAEGNEIPVYNDDGTPIYATDINGNPICDEDGQPVPETLRAKTIWVGQYIHAEEYSIDKICPGRRVCIHNGNTIDYNWFIESVDDNAFTIRNFGGYSEKFFVSSIVYAEDLGQIAVVGGEFNLEELNLVTTEGEGGLTKSQLPYGTLQSGFYRAYFTASTLPLPAVSRVTLLDSGTEAVVESVDSNPLDKNWEHVSVCIERRDDGFWYLQLPADRNTIYPGYFLTRIAIMTLDLADGGSLPTCNGGGLPDILTGLVSPEFTCLHLAMGSTYPGARFNIYVNDSGDYTYCTQTGYYVEFIKGGPVTQDAYDNGIFGMEECVYCTEFWVFNAEDVGRRKFVRLFYDANNNLYSGYSIIPESLE